MNRERLDRSRTDQPNSVTREHSLAHRPPLPPCPPAPLPLPAFDCWQGVRVDFLQKSTHTPCWDWLSGPVSTEKRPRERGKPDMG